MFAFFLAFVNVERPRGTPAIDLPTERAIYEQLFVFLKGCTPMVEALVRKSPIAIIGSGSIGVAWAIVFARAGHPVAVQDTDIGRLEVAKGDLSSRLAALESFNLIDEPPHTIAARVRWCRDLAESVAEAELVLEAVPENLEIKRIVFSALEVAAPAECVLASSSSAIAASQFAGHLPSRARVLVIHPGNPPYLIRVVELVPAPFTEPAIVNRAEAILSGAGMVPVRVRKEVEGFVFNRLQGAVLREAYCLVRDGVASVEDIDSVMREGLGPRWSIIGPFETVDLNTRGGIEAHAKRLGPAYARMGAERGQNDPWTDDLVAKVTAERRAKLPLSAWEERVAWRDRKLMAMAKIRVSTDDP